MNELKQLQDIQDEMREGYAPEKTAPDFGEPWRQYGPKEATWLALREDAGTSGDIVCDPPSGWMDSIKHWPDRASRIVACVNACAGMADPNGDISFLKRWREEKLAVESMWDEQAVGRLLGITFGSPIRSAILPAIKELSQLRWTPITDRMPTVDDANEYHDVEWSDGAERWDNQFYTSNMGNRKATHWRRIVLP